VTRAWAACGFLLLLLTSNARADPEAAESVADELRLSGSVRAGYWTSDRALNDRRDFTPASVWLKVAPELGDGFGARAEGWVAEQRPLSEISATGELREGFVFWRGRDLDLSIGRRIIAWGRADRINPTDVVGSRDYTLLFAEDDDQRRGSTIATASYATGEFTISGLWLPEFRPNVYPIPETPGVALDEENGRFYASQFGARVDHTGSNLDWSVSYFDGIDRNPDLLVRGITAAGVSVATRHRRTRVFGGDVATNIGEYGLRGEVAYNMPADRTAADGFEKGEFLAAVAGLDRNIVEHLNVNVQYVLHHTIDYVDPRENANPIIRAIAEKGALLNNQLTRTQHGTTFRVAYTAWHDTLTLELAAARFFTDRSTALRPKAVYAITDHVKVTAGVDLFFGDTDTFYGQLRDNKTAYLELRYGF
jgi:hypothetical protein